jgi:hypothetical protein
MLGLSSVCNLFRCSAAHGQIAPRDFLHTTAILIGIPLRLLQLPQTTSAFPQGTVTVRHSLYGICRKMYEDIMCVC